MKLQKLFVAVMLCTLALGAALLPAQAQNPYLDPVMLHDGDLPGLQLQNASTVSDLWPLVKNLPDYMRQPENPSPDPENIDIENSFVMVSDYVDGWQQGWGNADNAPENTFWAKIEYGYYINPQHALDALCYIVYNRDLPEFYNYYFWNDYYYSYHSVPNCRKLNYGDAGYYVTPLEGGGGFVFFVKSHYIFMVDSLQQSMEDKIINLLLSKIP